MLHLHLTTARITAMAEWRTHVRDHCDHFDRAVAARNGERLHVGQLHLRAAGHRDRTVSGAVGQRTSGCLTAGNRQTAEASHLSRPAFLPFRLPEVLPPRPYPSTS